MNKKGELIMFSRLKNLCFLASLCLVFLVSTEAFACNVLDQSNQRMFVIVKITTTTGEECVLTSDLENGYGGLNFKSMETFRFESSPGLTARFEQKTDKLRKVYFKAKEPGSHKITFGENLVYQTNEIYRWDITFEIEATGNSKAAKPETSSKKK